MNELCFDTWKKKKSIKQIILLIISLVHYWAGAIKEKVKESTTFWLPADLDVIPLDSWHPNEEHMVNEDYQIVIYDRASPSAS
jgi:hypothetical protein